MNKVLSDERLGAKLRVAENQCVIFDSFTHIYMYIYNIYIYIYIYIGVCMCVCIYVFKSLYSENRQDDHWICM